MFGPLIKSLEDHSISAGPHRMTQQSQQKTGASVWCISLDLPTRHGNPFDNTPNNSMHTATSTPVLSQHISSHPFEDQILGQIYALRCSSRGHNAAEYSKSPHVKSGERFGFWL